jgi:hypothetical protein
VAAKAKAARSKPQVAASRKWAAAGRAKQAKVRAAAKAAGQKTPRTKAQHAASVRAAAAGRAAQAARAAGKTYVSQAKPKAPVPDTWTLQQDLDLPGLVTSKTGVSLDLHALPVCGAVAVAEHLAVFTGAWTPDESVLELAELVRDATMADLLEHVRAEGFPGTGEKLAHFEQCDPGTEVPGLIYGLQLPRGYHAVLAHPGRAGAVSWGRLMPWCALLHDGAAPAEAWWLEWEAE